MEAKKAMTSEFSKDIAFSCRKCGKCCKGFTIKKGGLILGKATLNNENGLLTEDTVLDYVKDVNKEFDSQFFGDLILNSLTVSVNENDLFVFKCDLQTEAGLCSIQDNKPLFCSQWFCDNERQEK